MLDQSEADIITTTVGNQIPKTIAAMRWAFDLDARRLDLPAGERPGQRLPGQPVWLEDNQALMRRMITEFQDAFSAYVYWAPGYYRRFADTTWEQSHKAMRERGVGTEPKKPEEPTKTDD
jgi:hypothetical protein